jgi:hypothetical protein
MRLVMDVPLQNLPYRTQHLQEAAKDVHCQITVTPCIGILLLVVVCVIIPLVHGKMRLHYQERIGIPPIQEETITTTTEMMLKDCLLDCLPFYHFLFEIYLVV